MDSTKHRERPLLIPLFQDVFGSRVVHYLESDLLWAYARSFFNAKKRHKISLVLGFQNFLSALLPGVSLNARGRVDNPRLPVAYWQTVCGLSTNSYHQFSPFLLVCSSRLRQKTNYFPFNYNCFNLINARFRNKCNRSVWKNFSRFIMNSEFIFGKNDLVEKVFCWLVRIVEKSAPSPSSAYSELPVDNRRLLRCGFPSKYGGAQARDICRAFRPYHIDNVSRNDFVRTAGYVPITNEFLSVFERKQTERLKPMTCCANGSKTYFTAFLRPSSVCGRKNCKRLKYLRFVYTLVQLNKTKILLFILYLIRQWFFRIFTAYYIYDFIEY